MSSRFRPVIRVFVSSTFSDLKEERNALQHDVFPRVEHYCLVRGFQFQAIDLRWGVPGEAGRDHRTMQICFDELRRAQEVSPRPNFLVLLGDRYGWQPLPESLTNEEFTKLEAAATRLGKREPARELTAARALRTWYRRDDNADPVEYVLRSRYDWPDRGVWEDENAEKRAWEVVEQALWDVINEEYRLDSLEGRFANAGQTGRQPPAIVKFQGSATEQEIWRGALAVPDAPEHVVAWFRTIRNRDKYMHDKSANDFFDSNEALWARASELREELTRWLYRDGKQAVQSAAVELKESADCERLEVTRDHLQPMCDEIEARLREIVDVEIKAYWSPPDDASVAATTNQSGPSEARKLELETQAHQLFGESRAPKDGFVGREAEMEVIADYLRDENNRNPLVVHGPSGTGKTALLARASQIATEKYKGRIFLRFLGTTPQSSNLNALLTSLCRELRPSEGRANALPVEFRLLQDEFDRLLALATAEKPILLFLDALDQLDETDGGRQTYWLRTPLPPHVKVVVSCIRDEEGPAELNESYRCFDRRKLLGSAIAVESLTAPDAMKAIELWLQHDNRRPGLKRKLTPQQLGAIAARITPDPATACRRPLYLRILFEECRLWPSWNVVAGDELGEDTAALLEGLLTRLAQPEAHGALIVEAVLSYLASARRGLSESEILEVLWADPDYMRHLEAASRKTNHELPSDATHIPIAIWSRLRHDLDPYLAEHSAPGGVVLNFYHRVVGRVVADCFLKDAQRRCLRHGRLAEYFQSERQPWWFESEPSGPIAEDTAAQRAPNARRATELPRQLLREADESDPGHEKPDVWDTPVGLLCDLKFVEVKCAAGLVFELQEDYRITIAVLPEAQEGLRQERDRQARLGRWTEEITAYSRKWSERRSRLTTGEEISEAEPQLPAPPATCRMWTDKEIKAECKRIIKNAARLDRIQAFAGFVQHECYPLVEFGERAAFVVQHAFSSGPSSPVHNAAARILPDVETPMLIRHWFDRDPNNPKPALLRTLEGHTEWVYSVNVTPEGNRAVSGSGDKTLRVWDLESGSCLRTLEGHNSGVISVSVTPDGKRAVSGSGDKTLRVWDLESGFCLRTLKGHTDGVNSVCVAPDGKRAVSGSEDATLRVWDLESGACLRTLKGHTGWVSGVSVTPDGRRAVSGSWDKTLRVWGLESGTCLRTLEGHSGDVWSVTVTPDGKRAVSGSWDKTLRVWDLESGVCLRILEEHTDSIRSASVTADGKRAVSGGGDKTLRVWDLESGTCLRTLEGHADKVISVSVTSDGKRAVSGSWDKTLRVWDLESGASLRMQHGHTAPVLSVSVTPDGKRAVSGSLDNTLRVWDLERGACLRTLAPQASGGQYAGVSSVSVSADGKRAVSVSGDKTLRVWDLESGGYLRTLEGVSSVGVSADGKLAMSESGGTTLRVWDLESGACLRALEGHTKGVISLSVTPDGKLGVSRSLDNTLRVWDLELGKCMRVMDGPASGITNTKITPDGLHAVFASWDKTLRVWDLQTGRCLALACLPAPGTSVALSPKLGRVVAGTSIGQVLQFDLRGISMTAASQAS